MPSDCQIEFDHSNGVYNSGENLCGTIKLTTERSKTIRGIHITVNGYSKVKWEEQKTRRRNGRNDYYTVTNKSYDQYLDSRTYVAGNIGGKPFELPPGTYNYSFSCYLPLSLPTSAVGKYGEIKYEVIVTIDRLYKVDNVFRRGFTVIQELNLHLHPEYMSPKSAIENKEIGCKCCCLGKTGTVETKLEIPFGGYTPGQKIHFNLSISNDSESDLILIKVKLDKRIVYEITNPAVRQKGDECEVDSITFPNVLRLTRKQLEGFLEIPALPPSTLISRCFRIDYKLSVMIVTDGLCDDNIDLSIPIIIGTVPLAGSPANSDGVITKQPISLTANRSSTDDNVGGSPPCYGTLVPSSCEDRGSTLQQFDDNGGDVNYQETPFVPKYPVYNHFELSTAPSTSNAEVPATVTPQESSTMTSTYGWNVNS